MAFNGTGVHNRVHDWAQDLTNTIPVTASRMDAEHDDISSALSNTICRDGQSTTTGRIPFASGVSAAAGSTSAVAYAQINDPNTGMYFPATDQWGLAAGGAATLSSTATKITTAVAADFGGVAAPATDDGAALGSTSQKWSDLFLASGAVINFNSSDVTITHSSNALAFAGASSGYTHDAAVLPATSDGAALGNTSLMWSDLFLASGAVVNFNNGDMTLTHSVDTLTVAGGTLVAGAVAAASLTVGSNPISGVLPTRQVLTSGTGATYTTPANCRQLRIRAVGGGGGGGSSGANNGSDGGTTSFNSIAATGGSGGKSQSGAGADSSHGGAGGTGGSGSASFRMAGNPGQPISDEAGGGGGAGPFGGAGLGGRQQSGNGSVAAANSGAGGGGAGRGGSQGGGGGGAGEYVELIINSPSASYTYTIGAGGSGGVAGGLSAGGDGGSGVIIVDEYY